MTTLGSTVPYYGGAQVANPANVIATTGSPSTNLKLALGTLAVDNAAKIMYGAVSHVGGVTTWAILGGSTGAVATETGDTGTATPVAGNIKHAGTANQIHTAASGATITYSLIGPYTPATYTAHGVLIGEAATSIVATAAGTDGQTFIGNTGADPAFAAPGTKSGLTGIILGNGASAYTTTTFTPPTVFTPAFSLATPGDSAWTYSSQLGRYQHVGGIVNFVAEIVWSNFTNSTGSGNWELNLPVTAGAFARAGLVHISGSGIDAASATAALPANFVSEVGTGATNIVISVEVGGTGNATNSLVALTLGNSNILTSGTMTVSGWYFAE